MIKQRRKSIHKSNVLEEHRVGHQRVSTRCDTELCRTSGRGQEQKGTSEPGTIVTRLWVPCTDEGDGTETTSRTTAQKRRHEACDRYSHWRQELETGAGEMERDVDAANTCRWPPVHNWRKKGSMASGSRKIPLVRLAGPSEKQHARPTHPAPAIQLRELKSAHLDKHIWRAGETEGTEFECGRHDGCE